MSDTKLRYSFLPPPKEAEIAAQLLSKAANEMLSGNLPQAEKLIHEADIDALGAYALLLTGPTNSDVHSVREIANGPARGIKLGPRMPPKSVERELYSRDGYRCRFCGVKGVVPEVRQLLTKEFPDAARWGGSRATEHHAFQVMLLSPDHVLPYTRGGSSGIENLVAACYPCQFGRNEFTLEEVGISDPRERPPIVDGWDGLTRLLSAR